MPEKKFFPDGNIKSVKKQNEDIEFDKFEGSTASSMDCTGLIPTPPMTESELESYKELYDFEPPDLSKRDGAHDLKEPHSGK